MLVALAACGGNRSSAPAPPPTSNPTPDASTADAEQRDKLADACGRAMTAMSTAPEDLQTAMANVMLSCSQACDLGDQPSCANLDDFMQTTCSAVVSICNDLCEEGTQSTSLGDAACRHDAVP